MSYVHHMPYSPEAKGYMRPFLDKTDAMRVSPLGTGSVKRGGATSWQYFEPRVQFNEVATVHPLLRPDIRSPLQHLENIRAVLNPTVSELASIFDVSRQAIYKWLSEETSPEPEKRSRVEALSKIADAFKKAGVERAGSLLEMNAFNGRSLLDIVKTGEDWSSAVDLLIAESRAMSLAYDRSGLAKSKAKPTNDWLAYQSIPALREDE